MNIESIFAWALTVKPSNGLIAHQLVSRMEDLDMEKPANYPMIFEQLCMYLTAVSPEKRAFIERLVGALERDADGKLTAKVRSEARTLQMLLASENIQAADQWLRRCLIHSVNINRAEWGSQ